MIKKPLVSIATAAVLVSGPGSFALTAAAQTASRGFASGISLIPAIGTGMNGAPGLVSANRLTSGALLSPIAAPSLALSAVPTAAQPQAPGAVLPMAAEAIPLGVTARVQSPIGEVGSAPSVSALNMMFENAATFGGTAGLANDTPTAPPSAVAAPAPAPSNVPALPLRMESLYSIMAFTEGGMYETKDSREWSSDLVRERLNGMLALIDAAQTQVEASSAKIALTYARTMTAAEISDSYNWEDYQAGTVYSVFNKINGYALQAIDAERQTSPDASPAAPAPQSERLETLQRLSATIDAATYETRDGRDWSIDLVREKLNDVMNVWQPAYQKAATWQAKIALIRIRAIAKAEIADSGAWPDYSAGAVYNVFTKLKGYAAEGIASESARP